MGLIIKGSPSPGFPTIFPVKDQYINGWAGLEPTYEPDQWKEGPLVV